MSNLRLSHLVSTDELLTPGCCPGQFYAILFSPDGQSALKLISTSPDVWQMSQFVAAQQDSFSIPLEEDAIGRSFFYTKDLPESEFVLAGDVLPYSVEYWRRLNDTIPQSRADDAMVKSEDLYWNGSDKVAIILPDSEVLKIQSTEATAQVAYDSVSTSMTAIAYLLTGGVIAEASTYAAIQIYDADGVSIAGLSTVTQILNVPGAFKLVMQPAILQADSVYSMIVTVRLNGIDYVSVVPIVVYD